MRVLNKNILYTDDTGRLHIRDRGVKKYIMVAYNPSNVILVELIYSRKDKKRLAAYNAIIQWLKEKNLLVDLNVFDNKCSKEYQATMRDRWGVTFQPFPPETHRQNAAERAIQKFKAHFLAILAGVAHDFPRH